MKQCLQNFIQMKGLFADDQIYSITLMNLKANFTHFRSKGGLQVYRLLRSFSYCHQNSNILVLSFVFQEEAVLEHNFLECPPSID